MFRSISGSHLYVLCAVQVDIEEDATAETLEFMFADTPEQRTNCFTRLDQRYTALACRMGGGGVVES